MQIGIGKVIVRGADEVLFERREGIVPESLELDGMEDLRQHVGTFAVVYREAGN